ncbi:hypothetical protein ACHAPU_007155 [Fusarium lateritium]
MECSYSSLVLALELQRQDLDLLERSTKGKQRAGEYTDSELALKAYRHEIDDIAVHVSDRSLALSIARAVDTDARLIAQVQAAEVEAEKDRQFAIRLSANPGAQAESNTTGGKQNGDASESLGEDLITILESMNIGEPLMLNGSLAEEPSAQAESSSWAASRKPPQKRECVICTDKFSPLFLSRLPCSHEYCRECLVGLVTTALQDESLFPPRCCGQRIPVESGRWLTPQLVGQFKAKKLELDTPNRIYCSKPSCSTFVPPGLIASDTATCPRCNQRTCVHCKGPQHTGPVYAGPSSAISAGGVGRLAIAPIGTPTV